MLVFVVVFLFIILMLSDVKAKPEYLDFLLWDYAVYLHNLCRALLFACSS